MFVQFLTQIIMQTRRHGQTIREFSATRKHICGARQVPRTSPYLCALTGYLPEANL